MSDDELSSQSSLESARSRWPSPELESATSEDTVIPALQPAVQPAFMRPLPRASAIRAMLEGLMSTISLEEDQSPPVQGPQVRQNDLTFYPHGVVTGGILIDMAEYLSQSANKHDWMLSLWIQEHFIDRLVWIARMDGIIVESQEDMVTLTWIHQRYSVVRPMPDRSMRPQILWVPGLEPTCDGSGVSVRKLELPEEFMRDPFDASDMPVKKERKGHSLGKFEDGVGWERSLWKFPAPEEDATSDTENRMEGTIQLPRDMEELSIQPAQTDGSQALSTVRPDRS